MSWALVVSGVVAAGSAAYSANSANKRAKSAAGGLDGSVAYARQHPEMFGEKLAFEDVSYSPLFSQDAGYGNLAGDVIAGNQRNLQANLQLAGQTNDWISQDARNRITGDYAGFGDAFGQQARNTQNFLRGEIPLEDRNLITARSSEAQSLGGGGVNRQQTAADLGLARLDLMGRGQDSLNSNVNLWNALDPVSRRVNPQSLFVDVGQAMQSAVNENQFAANFAASQRDAELNYAMLPDPQKAGLANLLSARGGLQAANPQQSVAGAAIMGGVQGAYGAYQQQQPPAWAVAASQQQQPLQTYRPPQQTYASAADQNAGISNLYGVNYNSPAYAVTDAPQQGTFSSFFGGNKRANSQYDWVN